MIAFGCDIAREGADSTVVAIWKGLRVDVLHRWKKADTMETAQRIFDLAISWRPMAVGIDIIGVGSGVFDRLRELGQPVVPYNASNRTDVTDASGTLSFLNVRAASWWILREALDPQLGRGLQLPPDDDLLADLTAPRWTTTASGQIKLESKDDIRARLRKHKGGEGGGSTDAGDAVVIGYWIGHAQTGNFEQAYAVHTDGTLRASEVKAEEEMTEEERQGRYQWWESEKLFGRAEEERAVDSTHGSYGGYHR